MTIQEAANAWNVKMNTVFTYIIKGYIYGLTIENNEIIIPNIPKPYIIRKKLKTTSEYDRYILMAMDKGGYVNAKIMNIEQNIFAERLDALIRANKIYPKDNVEIDQTSNLSFVLCSVEKSLNIDVNINTNIDSLVKINATGQIGLINAKVET